MTAVIEVEKVQKSFQVGDQEVQILKGVSFQVKEKDFMIIFGPSGCGKSTLLHTMLGLEEPTSGFVRMLGEDVYAGKAEDDRSDFRKRHVGMIYQQPNWIKALNVKENVAFPLVLLGMDKKEALSKAEKQLEQVGMLNWADYTPTELSSGQQQRVSLARALINDPKLIVADEPTGNLDYKSGQQIMEMFMNLGKLSKTVIMVTHDLEYLKYATCAVEMLDGAVQRIYAEKDKDEAIKKVGFKRGVEKNKNENE